MCVRTFVMAHDKKRHMRLHRAGGTGSTISMHTCDICSKSFIEPWHLNRHRGNHFQTGRQHQCPHCNKAFGSIGVLKSHVGLHTGQRPYKCGLCPLDFVNTSGASKHRRRIHTVNNRYQCPQCSGSFVKLFELRTHLRDEHNYMLSAD